ncbi:uncharacterized protein LOC120147524 [Hibiscus syriacus]|uniref:uncharacterized protein LOC120147524 n=1 Tax=Hibiscus syriacus TaxID=106335 RepID=UPI001922F0E1|nr:uncharacterized protein LOC120147524 [Hibiscus syriacus]
MEITATSSSSSSLPATAIPQQSQWLQITLSDLDKKMKAIMTLLQESDESEPSCQKVDVSNDWKQELVKMLSELNRSYCSLARKHDQMRPKSQNLPHSGSSSLSSNSTEIQQAIDQRRALQASYGPTWEASSDTCHESPFSSLKTERKKNSQGSLPLRLCLRRGEKIERPRPAQPAAMA